MHGQPLSRGAADPPSPSLKSPRMLMGPNCAATQQWRLWYISNLSTHLGNNWIGPHIEATSINLALPSTKDMA